MAGREAGRVGVSQQVSAAWSLGTRGAAAAAGQPDMRRECSSSA